MSLALALAEAGWSQADLARKLGVSTPAVNQWVKGARAIPVDRQEQIEKLIGDLSTGGVNYQTIWTEARTMLSFVVLFPLSDGYADHDLGVRTPESLERRVRLLARETQATKMELEEALYGRALLVAADLILIGRRFHVHPHNMMSALGHKVEEKQAVWDALDNEIEYTTFDTAIASLKREKARYQGQDLTPGPNMTDYVMMGHGQEDLPMIEDVAWWIDGKLGAGLANPSEPQDLTGRFNSTEGGQ